MIRRSGGKWTVARAGTGGADWGFSPVLQPRPTRRRSGSINVLGSWPRLLQGLFLDLQLYRRVISPLAPVVAHDLSSEGACQQTPGAEDENDGWVLFISPPQSLYRLKGCAQTNCETQVWELFLKGKLQTGQELNK